MIEIAAIQAVTPTAPVDLAQSLGMADDVFERLADAPPSTSPFGTQGAPSFMDAYDNATKQLLELDMTSPAAMQTLVQVSGELTLQAITHSTTISTGTKLGDGVASLMRLQG